MLKVEKGIYVMDYLDLTFNGNNIVRLVNDILKNAFKQKAKKVALPSLPNGETPFEPELADKKVHTDSTFPVYFQIDGNWHLYNRLPSDYLPQIINRLLLISGIQYWKKSESERKIKVRYHGVGQGVIMFHYSPDLRRIVLNITNISLT